MEQQKTYKQRTTGNINNTDACIDEHLCEYKDIFIAFAEK